VPLIKLKNASLTRIGRHDTDFLPLALRAAMPLLEGDAPGRISRIYVSSFAPRELCGIDDAATAIADALKRQCPALNADVRGPYRTGGEALYRALTESHDGSGDILMVACEKMTHIDAGRAAGLLAPRVSHPIEQTHGATLPALAALATQAYMRDYRVPYHAFHHVAVKNHSHATLNSDAHFGRAVTVEDVASSPLVADPLRRHHCAPTSDGAAACILSKREGDITVRGWGRGLDVPVFHERSHLGRFPAAASAAADAWAMSGLGPVDMHVVEIHDAFSPFELMNLEEMGFFRPGEAWKALEAGDLHIGGRLAVNPSGGMKARGHPIGVCGLSSVAEMFLQLRGDAGRRQHTGARRGMIQSAGGVSRDAYAFVLEAT